MNLYQSIIAQGLKIDDQKAKEVFDFMCCYFDDFRFSSATKLQIVREAKIAIGMMELLPQEAGI